jgi:hypothetical protein
MELILNKKVTCLRHVSSICKKISAKTFGPHCVYTPTCSSQRPAHNIFTVAVLEVDTTALFASDLKIMLAWGDSQ